MRKNKIWNKAAVLGIGVLLETISIAGCIIGPVSAQGEDFGMPEVEISQSAVWTDQENFRGTVTTKIKGLKSLKEDSGLFWEPYAAGSGKVPDGGEISFQAEEQLKADAQPKVGQEPEANWNEEAEWQPEEEPEAEANWNEEAEWQPEAEPEAEANWNEEAKWQPEAEPEAEANWNEEAKWQPEAGQEPEANWNEEADWQPEAEPELEKQSEAEPEQGWRDGGKLSLVLYVSEYFMLEHDPYNDAAGCSTEEILVRTQDGRETTITKITCPVADGESDTLELSIPVVLRQEYRFPTDTRLLPVCQDEPLEISQDTTGTLCETGTYLEEASGSQKVILAKAHSAVLEIPAAAIDMSLSLTAKEPEQKAGRRLTYYAAVTNTGQLPLTDVTLTATVPETELLPQWEEEKGLSIQQNTAVLDRLCEGETRTLSFYYDLTEEQSGAMRPTVKAEADGPAAISREAALPITVLPLTAAFTVNKTADCMEARPGDTITYQISIHNTGERTLHSVISTERFLHSQIQAAFEETEGVQLNSTKTQARIPQIVPGGCVKLKAVVTLPENLESQDLVNQVIVVTDETGESEPIRSQAQIKVQADPTPTPIPQAALADGDGSGLARQAVSASASPKTGDRSHKELFEALILCSLAASAYAAWNMFFHGKSRRKEAGRIPSASRKSGA